MQYKCTPHIATIWMTMRIIVRDEDKNDFIKILRQNDIAVFLGTLMTSPENVEDLYERCKNKRTKNEVRFRWAYWNIRRMLNHTNITKQRFLWFPSYSSFKILFSKYINIQYFSFIILEANLEGYFKIAFWIYFHNKHTKITSCIKRNNLFVWSFRICKSHHLFYTL